MGGPDISGTNPADILAAIVESADDAILSKDLDGIVLTWNAAAERLYGYSAEEAVGQHISLIVPDELRPEVDQLIALVASGTRVDHHETVRIRRDGRRIDVSVSLSPIRARSGAVAGVSVIARDISARRRAEAEANFLSAIVESCSEAIVGTDLRGRINAWNPAAERVFGWSSAEAIGGHIDRIIPGGRGSSAREHVANGDVVGPLHLVRRRRDGRSLELETMGFPIWAGGAVIGVCAIYRDRTEERTSAAYRSLLTAVVEASVDAVVTVDEGRITSWNHGAESLFGHTRGEAIGRELSLIVPAGSARDVEELMSRAVVPDNIGPLETVWLRRDGTTVDVAVSASEVRSAFGGGTRRVLALVARDISEQRFYEEQLRHQAFHDSLTGLPNRSLMLDRLQHAIRRAAREESALLVAFIDLDHFKSVNDARGHPAGDKLLMAVSNRLQAAVRSTDTVARFGGDEFVALCEYTSADDLRIISARLQSAFAEPFLLDGQPEWVTASIGLSAGGGDSEAERLLHEADTAMYQAKRQGRNQLCAYDPEVVGPAESLLRVSAAIRRALVEDELALHYQPIVDLRDGRIVGAEALLRWNDPERGLVGPGLLIPTAEELGLIVPIGAWVLRAAAADTAGWSGLLPEGFSLHVNVSSRQLSSPELPQQVAETSAALPAGSQLVVELTESAIVGQGSAVLQTIRTTGVRLAVDDFGTGFSALSYLKQFPVDVVKIDRVFVKDLPAEKDMALIRAIVALASGLGIEVTVEGIETESQRDIVMDLGCGTGQGFLYSRAVPADAFRDLLGDVPT